MSSLYRFISFESFVDIVQSKQLTFVHPDLYEDPYECYLLKYLKDENNRRRFSAKLAEMGVNGYYHKIIEDAQKTIFTQSWTSLMESDALWRIYAHNNSAIRIEVNTDSISQLFGVKAHPINYIKEFDIEKHLERFVKKMDEGASSYDVILPYIFKRDSFNHEEEVRLIFRNKNFTMLHAYWHATGKNRYETQNGALFGTTEEFAKKFLEVNQVATKILKIPFDHIPDFIISVQVHPRTQDWFVNTVERYCEINGLNFIGRSHMYNLTL